MSIKFMRMLVLFDLPMETSQEKREYTKFRKYLIKSGFVMLQKSVYSRLVANANSASRIIDNIQQNKPKSAEYVQVLCVTEAQFAKMVTIEGTSNSKYIDTTDMVVIV